MFARKVSARLKAGVLDQFTDLMQSEVVPWLREQRGFVDLIILAAPDTREVATITFWDHQGNAYVNDTGASPEILKALSELLDGTPYVKTFEVVSSTIHKQVAVEGLRSEGSATRPTDDLMTRNSQIISGHETDISNGAGRCCRSVPAGTYRHDDSGYTIVS